MNIIINGASSGIGREVALFLAQDTTNKILITGRNLQALKTLTAEKSNIFPVAIDLSKPDELSMCLKEKVEYYFNHVDVMINMAGALVNREFMKIEEAQARLMMETNFFGPALAIRILKPMMKPGAHILNVSSMGGFQGSVKFKGLSYYSASKAAIACLSECLAEEFRDSGIAVNCLALGAVQTEMLKEAFPGYSAPVKAFDIAPFISYFALNAQRYMNGKIVPVAADNP